jgi:hypothetical protein
MTVSDVVRIGSSAGAYSFSAIGEEAVLRATQPFMSDQDDLFVAGNIEIDKDVSIGGNVTIAGVIFGDDYTRIDGALTASDHIDVRGWILNGGVGSLAVEIADDLSVMGELTVMASDIYLGQNDGTIDQIRFSGDTEYLQWRPIEDEFRASNDLSIAGRLTVPDVLRVGASEGAYAFNAIGRSQDLSATDPFMSTPNDLFVEGNVESYGDLSIGGSVSIAGVIFGDDYTKVVGPLTSGSDLDVRGRIFDGAGDEVDVLDDLSIAGELSVWGGDMYIGDRIATNANEHVYVSADTQYVRWNDVTESAFEMSEDLSVTGDLTISGRTLF